MILIAYLRQQRIWKEIQQRESFYLKTMSPSDQQAWQLRQFNLVWRRIIQTVPYYTKLQKQKEFPESFDSWDEFIQLVPETNRTLFQQQREAMTSIEKPPELWKMTGGTTAQPFQFPSWYSETKITNPNQWLGRHWFGIKPSSRAFWLWGHSHLFGTGI